LLTTKIKKIVYGVHIGYFLFQFNVDIGWLIF
jgi:hypothetical protein